MTWSRVIILRKIKKKILSLYEDLRDLFSVTLFTVSIFTEVEGL